MTQTPTTMQTPSIVSLDDYVPDSVSILVYGPFKSGKTLFAASWAEAGDVLFLDADHGMLSVRTTKLLTPELKSRIHAVPITDQHPNPNVVKPVGWDTLMAIVTHLKQNGEYNGIRPRTVVADSMTAIADMCMNNIKFVRHKSVKAQATLPNWGEFGDKLIEFLQTCMTIPNVHFICIAHEQYNKDETSGHIYCLPLLAGRTANKMGMFFDEVYHMTAKQEGNSTKYTLETKPTAILQIGSRFDVPNNIAPNYAAVMAVAGDVLKKKGGE